MQNLLVLSCNNHLFISIQHIVLFINNVIIIVIFKILVGFSYIFNYKTIIIKLAYTITSYMGNENLSTPNAFIIYGFSEKYCFKINPEFIKLIHL